MKRIILYIKCAILWFTVWLVLTMIAFVVDYLLNGETTVSIYETIFSEVVIIFQFSIGWIPISLYISDNQQVKDKVLG